MPKREIAVFLGVFLLTIVILPNVISGQSLVAYWKFDEGSGFTAYDSSGNGNDGSLQNIYPLDVIASNPSLEEPWYIVADQDTNHIIQRPDKWTVSYNFADSDKMLALQETGEVKDGDSAIRMAVQFVPKFDGDTFDGYISIDDCGYKFEIDETKYLEGGDFQYPIKGPSSYGDQTFYFYNATGHLLSRRWAHATDLITDVGGGWKIRSSVWQPSSLDPNPPTVGGDIPYIPQGAKYACYKQYFVWKTGEKDWEAIFDKFFVYQWTDMPTNEQRIGRASSGWVDGIFKQALYFDGVNDYVQVPDVINDGEFSIGFWFKPVSDNWSGVLFDASKNPIYLYIEGNSTQLSWFFESANDADVQITAYKSFVKNNWYHVIATGKFSSSGPHRLYINGVEEGYSTVTLNNKGILNAPRIGYYTDTYGSSNIGFNGVIDNFRIWNHALSAEEVEEEYKKGNLVGYWKFDEGSGSIAYDSSFWNNDGTINGGLQWVSGITGQALEFDGSSIYVDCGGDESLNLTSSITVSAWVKFSYLDYSGSTGKFLPITTKPDPDELAATSRGWLMAYDNRNNRQRLWFQVGDDTDWGAQVLSNTDVLTENIWYHFLMMADNNTIKGYVNGSFIGQASVNNIKLASPNNVLIGRFFGSYFNGVIDEVKIWDRVLTDEEISEESTPPPTLPPTDSIGIKTGWNLISFPFKTIVVTNVDCSPSNYVLYHWDSNLRKWEETRTNIEAGKGYYMYSNKDCTLSYDGSDVVVPSEIQLKAGWNQIGSFGDQKDINLIKGSCTINKGPLSYNTVSKTFSTVSVLDPNKGYWVRVGSDCQFS